MDWHSKTLRFYNDNLKEIPLERSYSGTLREFNLKQVLNGFYSKGLDIGCGTGRFKQLLSEHCEEVYAFDFSYNRAKLAEAFVADCANLPFKNNTFDFIFCSEVLQHISPENSRNVASEIKRVLQKPGRIVLINKNGEKLMKSKLENPIQWFSRLDLSNMFEEFRIQFYGDRIVPDKLIPLVKFAKNFYKIDSFFSDFLIKFCDSVIMIGDKR